MPYRPPDRSRAITAVPRAIAFATYQVSAQYGDEFSMNSSAQCGWADSEDAMAAQATSIAGPFWLSVRTDVHGAPSEYKECPADHLIIGEVFLCELEQAGRLGERTDQSRGTV